MPNRAFTATTSPLPAVSYEPRRQALVVYNNGTDTVFVSENAGSPSTDGVPVPPQVGFVLHGRAAAVAFWVQAATGTQGIRIYEGFGADERAAVASLAGTATSRPAWYDRTPTTAASSYNSGNIAPHVGTVRFSYTVPTGRKAFVGALENSFMRATAAAPVGLVECFFNLFPSGGVAVTILSTRMLTNTAGDQVNKTITPGSVLLPGDQITWNTSDVSTGGTVSYAGSLLLTSCDA